MFLVHHPSLKMVVVRSSFVVSLASLLVAVFADLGATRAMSLLSARGHILGVPAGVLGVDEDERVPGVWQADEVGSVVAQEKQ